MSNGRKVGGIDFDGCQFGPGLENLTAMLVHLSLPNRTGRLGAAFLWEYEEMRPLWPRERDLQETFVQLRHLWMLHWVLQRNKKPLFSQ